MEWSLLMTTPSSLVEKNNITIVNARFMLFENDIICSNV